ncbi:MAG: SDR family NAD(P)-dependent oxidoreductase [Selenomonadaceae bacterium]|nr:SDR family NAD(P)-dependent oxidoreductase [Selenomonadaceae bacterium]
MSNVQFDFTGENFVVTGASSGMGKQIAVDLAQSGAMVLAIARREKKLRELQERFPDNICIAPLDVCDVSVQVFPVVNEY